MLLRIKGTCRIRARSALVIPVRFEGRDYQSPVQAHIRRVHSEEADVVLQGFE